MKQSLSEGFKRNAYFPRTKIDYWTLRKLRSIKSKTIGNDKSWNAFLEYVAKDASLHPDLHEQVQEGTKKLLPRWMLNVGDNLPYIRYGNNLNLEYPTEYHQSTIADLASTPPLLEIEPDYNNPDFKDAPTEIKDGVKVKFPPVGSAVVVGRGPSLFINKHPEILAQSGYKGLICASDGGMLPLLEAGCVPHAVITVDGSPIIKKWFDHPLVRKHGPKMKWLVTTTVSHEVFKIARFAGMQIYWFQPQFDDYRNIESWTLLQRLITRTNKFPLGVASAMSGGNSGSAAWILAMSIFNRAPIGLIGIDFSYPEGTKLEDTQYFSNVLKVAEGDMRMIKDSYKKFHHPFWNCYDPETEVLTREGWKRFPNVQYNDDIITLNIETNEIEYQKPTSIITQDYQGIMYQLQTCSVDLFVTPNHNMVVTPYKRYNLNKKGVLQLKPASECFGKHLFYKKDGEWHAEMQNDMSIPSIDWLPRGVGIRKWKKNKTIAPLKVKMDDWLKFFGLWLADGHAVGNAKRYGYRIAITNNDKLLLQQLQNILKQNRLHSWINKHLPSSYNLHMRNKQIWTYLSQFGGSHTKFIPTELKNLNSTQLHILFNWYMKGDGYTNKLGTKTAYTVSQRLADDLQEIALKMGMSASLKFRKQNACGVINGRKLPPGNGYVITFSTRRNNPRVYAKRAIWDNSPFIEEWINYDGKVFCLSVPNRTLYVRRNGKAVWCGNSDCFVDFVFYHYRQAFLQMQLGTPAWYQMYGGTVNCTEGGSLYGRGIKCMGFKDFLERYPK